MPRLALPLRFSHPLDYAALSGAFALLQIARPLFTSNQHTYFLHGLARAEHGLLRHDWLAQTADPFPVFSTFVAAIAALDLHVLFFVVQAALGFVYFWSLLGLSVKLSGLPQSRVLLYTLGLLLLFAHSALLTDWSLHVLDEDLRAVVTRGVAEQRIWNAYLEPASAGVFLLLGWYLLARDRLYGAVVAVACAGVLHASYLMPAAVLTLTAAGIALANDRRSLRPWLLLGVAFAIVAPVLVYAGLTFGSADATVAAEARRILAEERIPHHALPAQWLDRWTLFQLSLVVGALALARGRGQAAFYALTLLTLGGIIVQWSTGSYEIALLFPWRASTLLVPTATGVLAAAALRAVARRLPSSVRMPDLAATALCLGVVFGLLAAGVLAQSGRYDQPFHRVPPAFEWAARTASPPDRYVIPPELQTFRLQAGVPVVADWKSHPYRAAEVVEWAQRIRLTEAVYETSSGSCEAAGALAEIYEASYVLFSASADVPPCDAFDPVYDDGQFEVYRIAHAPRTFAARE